MLNNKTVNYPAQSCRVFPDFSPLGQRPCWLSIRQYSAHFHRIIVKYEEEDLFAYDRTKDFSFSSVCVMHMADFPFSLPLSCACHTGKGALQQRLKPLPKHFLYAQFSGKGTKSKWDL